MELVTGRKGSAHITSQQDRMKHQGTWGSGAYILQTGQMLEPQVQSSNEIRIRDGALMVQGALSTVKVNSYDPVTIQNGTQGMKRIDLICWQYTYDAEQDVESAEWVVIQGTPAETDPQQPAYTDGDIQQGDSPVQVPVFAVELDGINVTGVTTLLPTAPTFEELNDNSYILTAGDLGLATRTYMLKRYKDGTFELSGRADSSQVRFTHSTSANRYYFMLTITLPDELTLADDRWVFSGSVASDGIYDLTPNTIQGKTLSMYISANAKPGQIDYINAGFILKGRWA